MGQGWIRGEGGDGSFNERRLSSTPVPTFAILIIVLFGREESNSPLDPRNLDSSFTYAALIRLIRGLYIYMYKLVKDSSFFAVKIN